MAPHDIRQHAYSKGPGLGLRCSPAKALMQEQIMTQPTIPMTEKAELKSFRTPDEVREFPKGRLELTNIGGATIGRAIFEPGWRWATSVQPIAKTSSCEAPHLQYHVAGVLRIRMDDGT